MGLFIYFFNNLPFCLGLFVFIFFLVFIGLTPILIDVIGVWLDGKYPGEYEKFVKELRENKK